MSFERYWAMLLKQWKLILGCFLIVGLGTFIISKLLTPMYQSTTVVQVTIRSQSNQSDYNSLLASDQLTQTEAQLAISNTVLHEVASHYTGLTQQQLTDEVTSTPRLNTQLFEISVLDASPTRAASLANDIATVLIKQQQQQTQQANDASRQQMQQDLTATQAKIVTTTNQIAALEADTTTSHAAQIEGLKVKLDGLQQHYNQWQTILSQLELTQAQSADFLRIAQPAQPAQKPTRPNVLLNTAIGVTAGLLLGILAALLFEQLDTRVRTPEELTELLKLPVLATVWRTAAATVENTINPQGRDPNIESYRILRTNVGFSSVDKPVHSLMVTSATPGDGKSTVTANLAIFMAKSGKNTLLIDGDLRRPTQHKLFQMDADKTGLSNAILACGASTPGSSSSTQLSFSSASASEQQVTAKQATVQTQLSLEKFTHSVGIPNLRVMPSGPLPPNPSDLLDSKAMERLFDALSTCGAEVVIFDAPPIRGISDASILCSKVDASFVVVDISRANKNHLLQVTTLLSQAGARVLGFVVNKQRRRRGDTSSYYYYQSDEQAPKGNAVSQPVGPTTSTQGVRDAVPVGQREAR